MEERKIIALEKIAASLDRITIALLQLGGSKIRFDVLDDQAPWERKSEGNSADSHAESM